jgi:plasmid stabilization system protein ParE
MATKIISIPNPKLKALKISVRYNEDLKQIYDYGNYLFGEIVAYRFIQKIQNKVAKLVAMPDANPKCRFIESTATKTYRTIIVEKYSVLYSVTSTTIKVYAIYHQHINPPEIKGLAK